MLTQIQALRAWAAIGVVLFHLGGALSAPKYFGLAFPAQLSSLGASGVLLFFVLSGFIIHFVHAGDLDRPERLPRYLFRRAMRLYPIYWVVLGLVAGFAIISGIGADGLPREMGVILKTILLAPQDKSVVGGTGAPVVIVAWSLQYEIMFYIGFGLLRLKLQVQHPRPTGHRMLRWTDEASTSAARNVA